MIFRLHQIGSAASARRHRTTFPNARVLKGNHYRRLWLDYSELERRQVLAAIFPAYIDGVFTLGDPDGAAPYPLADTFKLESNPASTLTIYMDFNGHHSVNNLWEHDIVFPAFDRDGNPNAFSTEELIEIQKHFQNVSEDYFPFNVNVTTKDPGVEALRKSSDTDFIYGVRDVNTQCVPGFICAGGVAPELFIFDADSDTPVFTFNKGVNVGAITSSHEVGHAVGLSHDGLGPDEYHPGTGSGETSWGPIMGAPFGANLSQWSRGEYAGATNTEDDLSIIVSSENGINYRADDYGNTIDSATLMEVGEESIFQWGFIGRSFDVDVFEFTLESAGIWDFQTNAFGENPNLDLETTLYDGDGNLIDSFNPLEDTNAQFEIHLNAGTYYIGIEGVGLPGVYTTYGSMGFYSISGTLLIGEVGETGLVTGLNNNWQTVVLHQSYSDPVVVFGPATRNGEEPLTVRVRNVTSNSFEVRIEEWAYDDGVHVDEAVGFVVFNAGTYELDDGTLIMARRESVTNQWRSIDLSESGIDQVPVVFAQTMTTNDISPVTERIRQVSANGFQLRLQEEQGSTNSSHASETVGLIIIEPGSGSLFNVIYEAFVTQQVVTHEMYQVDFVTNFQSPPLFLAEMQTYAGGDTANVRLNEAVTATYARLFIEEEQSGDEEMNHNPEVIGYFAIGFGPILGDRVVTGPDVSFNFGNISMLDSGTNTADAWRALENLESWGDVIIPFGGESRNWWDRFGLDESGGCCCAFCMNQRLNSLTSTMSNNVQSESVRIGETNSDQLDRSVVTSELVQENNLTLWGFGEPGTGLGQTFSEKMSDRIADLPDDELVAAFVDSLAALDEQDSSFAPSGDGSVDPIVIDSRSTAR
jgi:hypothetical protein